MEASKPPNSNTPVAVKVNGGGNASGGRPTSSPIKAQRHGLPHRSLAPPHCRRQRGCCCCCCCLSLTLLIGLVFLAAIAAGVFYVFYRPKRPSFSVSSLRLATLNISDADLLISSLDLAVTVRNRNQNLVFLYEDLIVSASSDGVAIGEGTIQGFAQGSDISTVLKATVSSTGRRLDPAEASRLRKMNLYPLEIDLYTEASVKMGGFKSRSISVRASCDGIEAAVTEANATAAATTTGSARCKVKLRFDIWNWTI
ncbi:hypothetical protein B296_00036820 [Ensete ventricosum]|uniref:Late embryogenesis abundant protein LEA-2 subgroup domain-containing protein n=1 Tax=Ensete ventricosum TaxID=4639 RepID=A0A427A1E1_ENSVE|nr:hypothetical protein B296_00036820 [Ensete ventricosum]